MNCNSMTVHCRYYQSAMKEAYLDFKMANDLNPENEDVKAMIAQFESVESTKLKTASSKSSLSDFDVSMILVLIIF